MIRDYLFDINKIIEGAASGDHEKVLAYSESLARRLESGGELAAAKRMRQIVGKSSASNISLARQGGQALLPVDGESRIPVADEERPVEADVSVFLSEDVQKVVDQFLLYFRAADRLIANGVGISPSLLIYGPPGVGKTQLARYIAAQLKYPLITARSDALISSYLGSTAKNIRQLFEHAASRPCVLFLDEFDALAKMRDDDRELGELKRVVISLMQNIDAMGRDHVLLAATNHPHLLDPAVWRRFAYKIEMSTPGLAARQELIRFVLGRFATAQDVEVAACLSEGMSGAQLKDITENLVREAVVNDQQSVNLVEMCARFTGTSDVAAILRAIRKVDKKRFTQKKLSELFGLSQSYISERLNQEPASA
ncbi:AAA ATPase central domain protein [Planctopirus limnophila DSM 3776]|uniref:AAA ATPase central domain protein n=1 Tax=Planctopirus limnophila (strain ATCC 43296 / DSM 3776 / IFAM 1008 / Mu 290) TaxID=521674 RepID=D5SMN0_PLAL2|nr:ATP-binding protein [Planctopirus limnophila]ADG67935.1 AAA ATPase central domain protein [Planctopirus limnophila DSM 3776]